MPTYMNPNQPVHLVGGFDVFWTPTWGNDPNLTNMFQVGWFNHQLDDGGKYRSFLLGWPQTSRRTPPNN